MIKTISVAECDLCGKVGRVKYRNLDGYHDTTDLPDGWGYGHNKNFTLCPECLALRGDSSVEGNSEK